jgi:hypothetical protein
MKISQQTSAPGLSQCRQQVHTQVTRPGTPLLLPRQPLQHAQQQHQQHQQQLVKQSVACEAFLDFLRGGGSKNSTGSSSKLVEKPLYSKRDMFNLGGLEVRQLQSLKWVRRWT